MRNKSVFFASAAACCALLASCGGGDSATPTPTPTSTGTPTPTPPTTIDFDFTKAFTATASGTSFNYAYFAPTGGSEVWSEGSRRGGEAKITFAVSPESVTLEWPDPSTLTTFSAADLLTASPTLRTYRKGSDGLSMELPFDNVLRVAYETTIPYTRETVVGNLHGYRYSIFYNTVTTTTAIASNLAYTGTAQVVGGKSGETPPGVFSSPATTLTVTSSDKKIAGTIQVVEFVAGAPVVRAALPISSTLTDSGVFAGDTEDTANAFKGKYVGSLAGPDREEVFLIFEVQHTDGRKFLGSLIGKR
ncbi:hypothetical protein [Qipengyuania sp. RANM35]|uniref:hypothetical protein n=1 Tax=Qipengyuania sp. RANM35 TaxID=3068635 RepID=UPI0034DB1F49